MQGEWRSAALVARMSVLAAPDGNPSAANSMATPEAVTVQHSMVVPFAQGAPMHFPPMSVTILEVMVRSGG